tara:strand:+ start:129 stop:962 length:834 start_codon:yes stop_codon:yes gene_type:complete
MGIRKLGKALHFRKVQFCFRAIPSKFNPSSPENTMFGEIQNLQGNQLDYSFHSGKEDSDVLVVIGHGVTGNKDRPFVKTLAEGLASAGIPTMRISFSGNGNSGGSFQDCTITKEISDLQSVLDVVSDGRRITYAGHSMGGAVGVLATSQDNRIDYLISLAGMVHTAKFAKVEFGDQVPDHGCMWEDEDCPLSSTYISDMNSIGSVLEKGAEIKIPWLLVHGTEDDVVPIEETHEIFEKGTGPRKKVVIEGADHVFSEEKASDNMVQAVVSWLKGQLQ